MPKGDITPDQALRGGQLICGMNATRLQLNNAMRGAAGLAGGILPSGAAEKIICLKNQNDLGLINGMFLTLEDIVDEGSLYFSAVVTDEDGRASNRWIRRAAPVVCASTRGISRTTSLSTGIAMIGTGRRKST